MVAPLPVSPGTYYVKEILKKRKRKGRVEMLVSWEDWGDHNTWEPVKNLPPDMVAAFGNRRIKQKMVSSESDSLQNLLLQEISKRAKFSTKPRTTRGTFAEKGVDHLSWRNYVRHFFHEQPEFIMPCCGKSYNIADSFITHWYRHHNRP